MNTSSASKDVSGFIGCLSLNAFSRCHKDFINAENSACACDCSVSPTSKHNICFSFWRRKCASFNAAEIQVNQAKKHLFPRVIPYSTQAPKTKKANSPFQFPAPFRPAFKHSKIEGAARHKDSNMRKSRVGPNAANTVVKATLYHRHYGVRLIIITKV